MTRFPLAALAVLMPVAAAAHDGVHINDAYLRSANPKTAAAFMELENHADRECRLVGVSTDAAEVAELHTHQDDAGVMKMIKVEDGFAVPAGGKHHLQRGGDHVMLMGLTAPLTDGQTITMQFDFGECGQEQAEIAVDNQRAPDDAAHGGGHGDDHGPHSH